MAARTGMAGLISRWRRLVDDPESEVWTDDQAQQILDGQRVDFWREPLQPIATGPSANIYQVYRSRYRDMESAASGTMVWRVYDGAGATIGTAAYTTDYNLGVLMFAADQAGSARYLDGRTFDLNAAAASAWRERAAVTARLYTFQADGGRYERSQWFEHCVKMADYFGALANGGMAVSVLDRTDVA